MSYILYSGNLQMFLDENNEPTKEQKDAKIFNKIGDAMKTAAKIDKGYEVFNIATINQK